MGNLITKFRIFTLIFATSLLALSCSDPDSEKETASPSSENSEEKASAIIEKDFSFRLFNERVSDSAIKTEVEQKVLVSGIPTREGLENEILKRYREISSRTGFVYHQNPTNIFIYVYGSEEQARSGGWTWVAMLAKSFGASGTPKVSIDETRLADLSSPPEEKFGLSEETRKIIFKEMADAEDRAMKEARAKIPDSQFMEQFDLKDELEGKYKSKIAEVYGLNENQFMEIMLEGVLKGWPY
ncbi:MAG: hypothetical protein IH901_04920 [Proteobacteria bacterium]|nr:hypothetical protein [Pseudomonadota bacterium]